MDRRQQKSRQAIFEAFSRLLKQKRYENITVQEIIDSANVCRSTFYSHFETKDTLIKAMCSDIFDHIFEGELCDFDQTEDTLNSKLNHIMWHLKNSESDVVGLLSSESSHIFLGYLEEYLAKLFAMYLNDFPREVPEDFLLCLLSGSFCRTLQWWIKNKMSLSPDKVADYFLLTISKIQNQ